MARLDFVAILLVGVVGVSCYVDQEDTEFPSLMTGLGSKLALADDYYVDDEEEEVPPRPCCFPATWQGRAVHELATGSHGDRRGRGSGPVLSRSIDQFYVDGARQRLAGDMTEIHGHHGHCARNFSWTFSVSANRTGDLYIFNKAEKKCVHRTLQRAVWNRQCIPANATLRGSFSLGPAGGLSVQSWSFGGKTRRSPAIDGDNHLFPGPGVAYGANILVAASSCIPVLLQEHGFISRGIDQQQDQRLIEDTSFNQADSDYETYIRQMIRHTTTRRPGPHPGPRPRPRPGPRPSHGVGFTTSAYFSDVQTRITDPSVFDVPAYCKKADDTLHYGTETDPLPTILERFILL